MSVSKTSNPVCRAASDAANVMGKIANGTDTLKKASSVGISALEITSDVLGFFPGVEGVRASFGMLKGQLKTAKTVIGGTSLMGRVSDWANPNERNSILKSWQKTASRVVLTVAQFFETALWIDKLSVGFFCRPLFSIGGIIPIFELVKNSLYAVSAGFAIWTSAIDLKNASKVIEKASGKKRKWEAKQEEFAEFKQFKREEILKKYQKKAEEENAKGEGKNEDKIGRYKAYIKDLKEENVAAFQNQRRSRLLNKYEAKEKKIGTQEKIQREIKKAEDAIEGFKAQLKAGGSCSEKAEWQKEIKIREKEVAGLKADALKSKTFAKYKESIEKGQLKSLVDYKIKKSDTHIHNGKNVCTKSWISIAAEVGKIFMIVVGTLLLGLGAVFPVLTTPASRLAMSGCGLVANGFGLAKNLYRDIFFEKNKKSLPVFELKVA